MMSKISSALLLTLLTLIAFSNATVWVVQCYDGASAEECNYNFGTYCNSEGVLLRGAHRAPGCTTKKDRGIHPGGYCECKILSFDPPKKNDESDITEILQHYSEVVEADAPYIIHPDLTSSAESSETSESSEDEILGKRQNPVLPTGALNSAFGFLGSVSSVLGHTSMLNSAATSIHASTTAHSATSTHSQTPTSTATPHSPSNGAAAGRKTMGIFGTLGVVIVGLLVGL
ncbi:hypothetical protein VTL71DRAFT_9390 [Oculimacula yallundae]|uniref:Uncharacterized protein n=1 Tax=Oculimacula yallundae TaxID=86028 RepID=A0ABR4BSX1_9HELO